MIQFDTKAFPCDANSVTIFGRKEDADLAARGVRAGYKIENLKASVRIIPRSIRVANLDLKVFALVIGSATIA